MTIKLDWEPRGVVRTLMDTVDMPQYLDSSATLQNDPRFDALRYLIEDFSAVEQLLVTEADFDLIAAHAIGAALSNPHIRIAAVAQSDSIRRLIRKYARDCTPYVIRLFDTMDAARAWIGEGDTAPVPLDIQLQAAVDFDTKPVLH